MLVLSGCQLQLQLLCLRLNLQLFMQRSFQCGLQQCGVGSKALGGGHSAGQFSFKHLHLPLKGIVSQCKVLTLRGQLRAVVSQIIKSGYADSMQRTSSYNACADAFVRVSCWLASDTAVVSDSISRRAC